MSARAWLFTLAILVSQGCWAQSVPSEVLALEGELTSQGYDPEADLLYLYLTDQNNDHFSLHLEPDHQGKTTVLFNETHPLTQQDIAFLLPKLKVLFKNTPSGKDRLVIGIVIEKIQAM